MRAPITHLRTSILIQSAVVAALCPAPYTHLQSQRDCVLQPRVARSSQPWALGRNPFGILPRLFRGERSFDCLSHFRRIRRSLGFEAFDELAIFSDEKFAEVPFDVPGV